MHNDFIYTSREGFSHANDVSAYSFVLTARMAKELDFLNENASLVTLTYHGSTKVLEGYNVMGIKDFGSILTEVEKRAPLHRNVTTTQVGNVATFLLSNMSDAITGQVIYADSGYNIMGV